MSKEDFNLAEEMREHLENLEVLRKQKKEVFDWLVWSHSVLQKGIENNQEINNDRK